MIYQWWKTYGRQTPETWLCLSNIRKSWWFSIRSTRFSGPCCWASWSGVYRRSLQVTLGSAWHCQILQTFMAMEHQPRLCSELTSSCHTLLHFTYLIEIPFQTYIHYLLCLLWFISFFRWTFWRFLAALSMGIFGPKMLVPLVRCNIDDISIRIST